MLDQWGEQTHSSEYKRFIIWVTVRIAAAARYSSRTYLLLLIFGESKLV